MTKSSRVNQRNREVVMTVMYRPLPPGAELARGRRTLLAVLIRAMPSRVDTILYAGGLVRHRWMVA
jgi:hypothetical protein